MCCDADGAFLPRVSGIGATKLVILFCGDLIRQVRACKTAAEERDIIAKESAALRTAFKDDDPKRHRNVVKLMFMHMLGYPTHFGQMECVKLIAASGFPEKRMGYLGFMLLLDEKQELLMLVTNSIKTDFNNPNQFIVGVALCVFANLCSAEMASDLATEVSKLLKNGNPRNRGRLQCFQEGELRTQFLGQFRKVVSLEEACARLKAPKQNAALCCVRVIRKVPEFGESLLNPAVALLADKHHGVLVAALKLCIVLCQTSNTLLEQMRKEISNVVQILRNLLTSEYRAEYDVSGIVDPLLQIEILRLLRIVGRGDADSSDIMSDVLAQVITNTDATKVPGSAILYECVQTVMHVEATQGLRVLAINVLGRFLSNSDNNIRYVALNMLLKIVPLDFQAIQRHRSTVMECLNDADLSIKRRALDLVYALASESNVKGLTKDLLEFLRNSARELKQDLTTRICSVIQKKLLYHKLGKKRKCFEDIEDSGAMVVILHSDIPLTSKEIIRRMKLLDESHVIGHGGFGTPVYKLVVEDGNVFAVKRIDKGSLSFGKHPASQFG
ncbi:hypothetical protein L7F22_038097 [Adiantum nelumboides]|nr:hypothetical protein [Adiantum nelumboides]